MSKILDIENLKIVAWTTAIWWLIGLGVWIWSLQTRISNIEITTKEMSTDTKVQLQSIQNDMVEIKKSIAVLTLQASLAQK